MRVLRVLLVVPALTHLVAAQESINLLSVIVSEAESVYTQVNSILSSAASAASVVAVSATTTSTSSDTSSSSLSSDTSSTSLSETSSTPTYSSAAFGSISSSQTSSPSTSQTSSLSSSTSYSSINTITSSSTLSTSPTGTSSVLGAAETSTSGVIASDRKHKHLAIILGCVLGALALGLLLLLLLLCCRRRRHGSSPRHSALSAGDEDFEAWRTEPAGTVAGRGNTRHARGASGAAPLMTEHPAYRSTGSVHDNPFAPVPPPPRKTAPNARPGLTDYTPAGDNPFTDKSAVPSDSHGLPPANESHHKAGIAAGIAAAAAGAGLIHEHRKHDDNEKTLINDRSSNESGIRRKVSRKPVPSVNPAHNGESWPYDPVSPIDHNAEMAALTGVPTRSGEDRRRSSSRDAARANAAFDQQYTPRAPHHGYSHELESGAAGLAAGAVGGAALAHHHDQDRRRSRSSSSSAHSRRQSRPPLAVAGEDSDHSSSSRNSRGSRNNYSDALPVQAQAHHDTTIPAQNDLYGVPMAAAPSNPRRNSGPGIAMPGAAAFTHANRPAVPSPLSSEIRPNQGDSSPSRNRQRRSSSSPRASMPYDPMSHDYGAYPAFPGVGTSPNTDAYNHNYVPNHHSGHGYSTLTPSEAFPSLPFDDPTPPSHPDKAIVGDNGYPHMGLPRRKSGGEYDLPTTGPLGPQTLSSSESSAVNSRNTTMKSFASGDDADWRMSSGMPAGWQRSGNDSARNSREYGRDSSVGRRRMRASDVAGFGGGREDGYGQAL